MALCWLVMVDAYLRPSEAVDLKSGQVIPRQRGLGHGLHHTALHLNPDYLQRPSKTGELDESVLLSREWVGRALEKHAQSIPYGRRLWDFNLEQLRKEFLASATTAGVQFLNPVLYMGRHSGASLDRLERRYSLEEVRKRGRWRSQATVARYEKKALIQDVLHRMRAVDKAFCKRAAEGIMRAL